MDTLTTEAKPREQTRARYPDQTGFVERDGVRVFWEAYGTGDQTILLLPTWEIVHSRIWKGQIPYLARRFRVVTFDPRGNGRSDRPPGAGRLRSARVRGGRDRHPGHPGRRPGRWSCRGAPASASCWPPRTRSGCPPWWTFVGRPDYRGALRRVRLPVRRGAAHRGELGQVEPPVLAAGLARLRGVLLLRVLHRAAFDQADRGRGRLGPGDRPGDHSPRHGGRAAGSTGTKCWPRVRGSSAPCW